MNKFLKEAGFRIRGEFSGTEIRVSGFKEYRRLTNSLWEPLLRTEKRNLRKVPCLRLRV